LEKRGETDSNLGSQSGTMVSNVLDFIKKFTHSLRFRLSFYAGLVVFLAMVAFTYHSLRTQEANLVNAKVEDALKDSEVIKAAIWNGMMTKDREVIRQIVRKIGERSGFAEISVYDWNGTPHYTAEDTPGFQSGASQSNPNIANHLKEFRDDARIRHEFADDGKMLTVVNPLLNTRSCSTAECHAHPSTEKVLGALELKIPVESLRKDILAQARNTVVFAFLLFVLVSTIIGLGVIFLVSRPMKSLSVKANRLARGQYTPGTPVEGSDSVAALSRSFDEMSRQIRNRTIELEKSRSLYKMLFEEVPCYLTVVSRDYRLVRLNTSFKNLFGDLCGQQCFVAYKGLDARCARCPVEKTFSDGATHQSEEMWNVNGQKIYVMVKTSPIFDDAGSVSEVMEMAVDVTRMKRLQMELEKKQAEFKYLYENVPCYLTVVDRDFNIVQTNKLFERDFGGQNLGEKCFRIYKGTDSRCDNCPVEKTFLDGETHTSEEVWRRNGQDTHIIVYTAPVYDDQGTIKAVMEMSTNITEVKRLQGELLILGETIAGMSHTIKNILTGLQGGVYVVDSGIKRGNEERVRLGWEMVRNNVGKVSDLVKGILYASKERQPEYRECDPGDILAEVCDLYHSRAASDGIEIVREFTPQMEKCLLDPAGIHSVLSNLISNAVEACRNIDSSERPRRIVVRAHIFDESLFMTVSDTGPGMPQEVRNKLFNKFYSTKGARGTGLGLVITRKVVEEHHGRIIVESEPDMGTTFTIEIPLRFEHEHEEKLKAAV